MDLFGFGEGKGYQAKPPPRGMRPETPPWRKKRVDLPQYVKLAQFWRCDLLEVSADETKTVRVGFHEKSLHGLTPRPPLSPLRAPCSLKLVKKSSRWRCSGRGRPGSRYGLRSVV